MKNIEDDIRTFRICACVCVCHRVYWTLLLNEGREWLNLGHTHTHFNDTIKLWSYAFFHSRKSTTIRAIRTIMGYVILSHTIPSTQMFVAMNWFHNADTVSECDMPRINILFTQLCACSSTRTSPPPQSYHFIFRNRGLMRTSFGENIHLLPYSLIANYMLSNIGLPGWLFLLFV